MLHYVFIIAGIVIFLVGTVVLNCTALFSVLSSYVTPKQNSWELKSNQYTNHKSGK